MPVKNHYLIRREADGTMRTVTAQSCRGAMVLFAAGYGPEAGEVFRVKERGFSDWEYYKIVPGGIRKLRD